MRKAKFRVGQKVIHNEYGSIHTIAAIDTDGTLYEPMGFGMKAITKLSNNVRHLTAKEIGPRPAKGRK